MKNAFGKVNLIVSVPVENNNETMGLMEANYKFMNVIAYELVAVDCNGNKHKVTVHDGDILLDEFVE